MITDRTGEDDATFEALLARVEAAEEAPESVRERVARAIWQTDRGPASYGWGDLSQAARLRWRRLADVAIDTLRGEA